MLPLYLELPEVSTCGDGFCWENRCSSELLVSLIGGSLAVKLNLFPNSKQYKVEITHNELV